ncbi:uncharacterized protein SCHCODRAFT_02634711 [Schizophyllum commune H4-8]|uniref:uncharacterized protein n=1 Tax=Schizophyllum commune (strain H4-8 / FGSC 9210) TaxID=578458 RepID=UPI00215F8FC2|nr:uncharacterized protein SCHCODRAFT_02634711 [Schizophyllum commune H4-8]KAI5889497.1 hypothetical protein SCHCODRAFT_02634711 [Schizophyllum commune H4-8]
MASRNRTRVGNPVEPLPSPTGSLSSPAAASQAMSLSGSSPVAIILTIVGIAVTDSLKLGFLFSGDAVLRIDMALVAKTTAGRCASLRC